MNSDGSTGKHCLAIDVLYRPQYSNDSWCNISVCENVLNRLQWKFPILYLAPPRHSIQKQMLIQLTKQNFRDLKSFLRNLAESFHPAQRQSRIKVYPERDESWNGK